MALAAVAEREPLAGKEIEESHQQEKAMTISHRREFLKSLGIAIPVGIVADPDYGVGKPAPSEAMTAEDVFTIFVSEAMRELEVRGLATGKNSTNRLYFEVQGTALALVLSQLQQQRDRDR